jgi:hypothetical protein
MDQIAISRQVQCCVLLRNLALTDKRIATSRSRLARQREIVEELERGGGDSVSARKALTSFETVHSWQVADRDRLIESLSQG